MTDTSSGSPPGPMRQARVVEAVSTLARLLLGVVLVYAGYSKLILGVVENGRSVMAYELFSWEVSKAIGTILPTVEIILGLLLLLGLLTRVVAGVTALLWLVFIAGILSAWARGLEIDCGCFGKGGPLAPGQRPEYLVETLRDLGLLACSLLLSARPLTWLSADGLIFRDRG